MGDIVIIENAGCCDYIFEDAQCIFLLQWSPGANECLQITKFIGAYVSHLSMKM